MLRFVGNLSVSFYFALEATALDPMLTNLLYNVVIQSDRTFQKIRTF